MPHFINIASTGSFGDNTTFARAMTSTNAFAVAGSTPIVIGSDEHVMKTSAVITLEDRPLTGIFLNISSVDPDLIGTISIIISAGLLPSQIHTFTYYTSSILAADYTSFTTGTISNYWQGFDLQGLYIGPASVLLSVICTIPGEVTLYGGIGNNYNRLLIPTNTTDFLSTLPETTVCIGSYIQPIASGSSVVSSTITHDINSFGVSNINIWNGGTLNIVSPAVVRLSAGGHLTVSPGGTLNMLSGTQLCLDGGSMLKGLDLSVISISGTYKLPYSFLDLPAVPGNTQFTAIDPIDSWKTGDTIFFTKNNSPADTRDTVTITNVTTPTFTSNAISNSHIHVSDTTFGPNFRGTPICNLTRDTKITTANQGAIVAEKSCSLTIHNTELNGLGWGDGRDWCLGSINLFNTNTNIQSCSINGMYGIRSTWHGLYINALSATNYTINSNTICNQPYHGVIVRNAVPATIVDNSSISNNVVTFSHVGIASQNNRGVSINSNSVVGNRSYGIAVNTPSVGYVTPTTFNTISSISNNTIFNNSDIGFYVNNSTGSINNNVVYSNRSTGVYYTVSETNNKITLNGIRSYFNIGDGINLYSTALQGGLLVCKDLNSVRNLNGIMLTNTTGVISGGLVNFNTNYGIKVFDCYKSSLRFYSITANNHRNNFEFFYPGNNKNNFYPVYITNCNLGSLNDRTAIDLIETNCERFTVENTALQSSAIDIGLSASRDRLIEGSYIFNNCTFSTTMFDSISTKYQTEVFNETGFVSMYHNGNVTDHRKYLVAGTITSDTTTYFDPASPISEKLTPNSRYIPLKSSRKVVPIDNYSGDTPPTLQPEFLTVSVYVKKDSSWGSNSDPCLVMAACPTLNILNDTVLAVHSTSTTNWVKLTTTTPAVSAINQAAAVEFYVECSGNSGGSINIDNWEHTFI